MCWITLTPTRPKNEKHASSDRSSADLVRVRHTPNPRLSPLSIALPSSISASPRHHHHHHHHPHMPDHMRPHAPLPHGILQHHHRHPHLHLHPLHLHPLAPLHGAGKKLQTPCAPAPRHTSRARAPPPSISSSSSSSSSDAASKTEPTYRTQIVEPGVRAGTRRALRDVRVRGGLRRVGGYEVLGRSVPWDWECVSSTVGSSRCGGGDKSKKKKETKKKMEEGGLRYPPFGGMERWL
ncbi:uncharacterized protein M421DRAFT_2274 [Didymella exigua CBS 183.55]|uniref:Uncharacterized protein n=1 Tax=Didymella exigua CBS 183.55 TaxID=1150837 RepID=A0A6A5RT45_9PLEO|nr:uncharacterized protein M421DRAFT_2274 [Didymella exigua CBS 183.55]KAF1931625.1 hypothetical protein M421DRAFT_2274 [Didymella exigua CBS 183.55]